MRYTCILLILAANNLHAQEYVKGVVNFQSKNKAFIEKLYQQASPNQKATTDVTIQRLFSKNRLVKIMPTYEGTKDDN